MIPNPPPTPPLHPPISLAFNCPSVPFLVRVDLSVSIICPVLGSLLCRMRKEPSFSAFFDCSLSSSSSRPGRQQANKQAHKKLHTSLSLLCLACASPFEIGPGCSFACCGLLLKPSANTPPLSDGSGVDCSVGAPVAAIVLGQPSMCTMVCWECMHV